MIEQIKEQTERQNIEASFSLIVDELEQRLFYGGIEVSEKKQLIQLKNQILSFYKNHYIASCEPEKEDLYVRVNNIIKELSEIEYQNKSIVIRNTYEFINKNSSILPLVLANNQNKKIKPSGKLGTVSLCQFHVEKTPSFIVNAIHNVAICYGCGFYANPIEYIRNYEHISLEEAMFLIAKIFCLYYPGKKVNIDKKMFIKYREMLISVEYLELLNLLEQKYLRNADKYSEYEKEHIETKLSESYDTVERVKNNNPKKYKKVKKGTKKLEYKIPVFDTEI